MPELRASEPTTRRSLKTLEIAATSFAVFYIALFIGDAWQAGSTFALGEGHALFFVTFDIAFLFPILVGLGFLFRWLFERVTRRRLPFRTILPWWTHLPLSIAFLVFAAPDRSPSALFRQYISDDVPASLSDFRYSWTSTFNNRHVVLSFRIDPAEFKKVLSRYAFAQSLPDQFQESVELSITRDPVESSMNPPLSQLVQRYEYDPPTNPDGSRPDGPYVNLYTTQSHDYVLFIHDDD
jgi:hypothetical protein